MLKAWKMNYQVTVFVVKFIIRFLQDACLSALLDRCRGGGVEVLR